MPPRTSSVARSRLACALLVACALLLAVALLGGCGDKQQSADAEKPPSDAGAESVARLDLREPGDYGEPVDLPEGVAATVEGQEISEDEVEGRFDAVANDPEVAPRLEGEQGAAFAEASRAQIVQHLITQAVVAQGAAEMGLEPSDDHIEAVKEQAIADFAGDREQFEEALRADGVTAEEIGEELVFSARVDAIREVLAEDLDGSERDSEATGMDPADLALDEWLGERLATADVVVDREYGVWHGESGEVVPPGALDESSR